MPNSSRAGKLPDLMESETITRALAGLADPNSPYYPKVISTLFAKENEQAKDYAWDMSSISPHAGRAYAAIQRARGAWFPSSARHGAVECSRCLSLPLDLPIMALPPSKLIRPKWHGSAVALRPDDGTCTAVWLVVSNCALLVQHSYSFGSVFRYPGGMSGGQPSHVRRG